MQLLIQEIIGCMCLIRYHNYDVVTGSEITPCNKIDKPLMVYIFSGNFMVYIIKQRFYGRNEVSMKS